MTFIRIFWWKTYNVFQQIPIYEGACNTKRRKNIPNLRRKTEPVSRLVWIKRYIMSGIGTHILYLAPKLDIYCNVASASTTVGQAIKHAMRSSDAHWAPCAQCAAPFSYASLGSSFTHAPTIVAGALDLKKSKMLN